MLDPLSNFIDRLATGGWDPIATGADSWESRCPGHNGQGKRNLSITRGDKQPVLVNCHHEPACSWEQILAGMGENGREFMAPGRNGHAGTNGKMTINGKAKKIHRDIGEIIGYMHRKFKSEFVKTHNYLGLNNKTVMISVRFIMPAINQDGKKEKKFLVFHPVVGGWVAADPPGKLPLYNLPELPNADTVYITEGEKCSDSVKLMGLVPTTSPHGAEAKFPSKADWMPLAGKQLVILADYDERGDRYAEMVLECLASLDPRPTVRVVRMPAIWQPGFQVPPKSDIANWMESGVPIEWTMDQRRAELERVVAATEPETFKAPDPARKKEPAGDKEKKKSQVELILDLVEDATIIRSKFRRSYIMVNLHGYDEVFEVESRDFKNFLINMHESVYEKQPSPTALKMAIDAIDARGWAMRESNIIDIRVAGNDELIHIDTGDKDHHIIAVTAEGWEVVQKSHFHFCRPENMAALPLPVRGGSLDLLWPFVNCSDEEFRLVIAWITACLRPQGPYCLMAMIGEQGSAKSTLTNMLKLIIDPRASNISSEPDNVRNLMISASKTWLLAYDNISSMPGWMSDAFCRLVMGAGYTTRTLYSNDGEFHFQSQRPIILNGITDFVNRPDLLDRCLFIHLMPLLGGRMTQRKVDQDFQQALPLILGAIYDAISIGMRTLPQIEAPDSYRMADFAAWGEAISIGLGWPDHEFLKTYAANQQEAEESLLGESMFCDKLRALATGYTADNPLSATSTELLNRLNIMFSDPRDRPRDWPQTVSALSRNLKRFTPGLRKVGVMIGHKRTGTQRCVLVWEENPQNSDANDT